MSKNKKNQGVLYIRYDRDSLSGIVIERLKEQPNNNYKLNKQIVDLIFLSEVVEISNLNNIDKENLNQIYYQSLNLFSTKVEQSKYRIKKLTDQIIFQKNSEEKLYLDEYN
ncbi:MAG: hypothetical protein ACRC2S_00410 [Waterburya sp.]